VIVTRYLIPTRSVLGFMEPRGVIAATGILLQEFPIVAFSIMPYVPVVGWMLSRYLVVRCLLLFCGFGCGVFERGRLNIMWDPRIE